VAASFKVSGVNAQVFSGGFCGHSTGINGGCMPACTDEGRFTGAQCGVICGTGQSTGACPVGSGGDNPCCNIGYCDPDNFNLVDGVLEYTGDTTGCNGAASAKKQGKAKRR
jgi:hypothetical protein